MIHGLYGSRQCFCPLLAMYVTTVIEATVQPNVHPFFCLNGLLLYCCTTTVRVLFVVVSYGPALV